MEQQAVQCRMRKDHRWNLRKGVVVIPGSSNPDHIQENIGLYDFELKKNEMREINA